VVVVGGGGADEGAANCNAARRKGALRFLQLRLWQTLKI